MIGDSWRQKVALSVLGEAKGELMPDMLFIGLVDASGSEVSDRAEVDNDGLWEGAPNGVTNTDSIYIGDTSGTPSAVVLWDAPEDGNQVLIAEIDEPETGEITIPVGGIIFEVA